MIAINVENYRRKYEEHKKENCKPKCGQKINLTTSQKTGLDLLRNKIKEGDILIWQNDMTANL